MKRFSELLDKLYFTYGNLEKARILKDYITTTPDPERGYAIAIIGGLLDIPEFKRSMMKDLIAERVDPVLFELSYDYVGELSETVAHMWPGKESAEELPLLSEIINTLRSVDKAHIKNYVEGLLDVMNSSERWTLLKLGRGTLRIGISEKFLKNVLADYGNKNVQEIETIWHGIEPPYINLFAWLEGKAEKPAQVNKVFFQPVMLSHPLEEKNYQSITPEEFTAEWKYDGIRIQLSASETVKTLYSRSGDDISGSFPDVLERAHFNAVIDGELLIKENGEIGSFNDLQQRLNRKAPSKKMIEKQPGHIIAYDMLFENGEDIRNLTFTERRARMLEWFEREKPEGIEISQTLDFKDFTHLTEIREQSHSVENYNPNKVAIEGVMLKRKDSPYISGRPSGQWYKWKRDPYLIDAVMMYAQRGHGKRSSFYSDYTYGLWKDENVEELLPVGKAYFGFTDEELKLLDKWVRSNTTNSFGPVREVEKKLVLEIAFDSVNESKKHKSGYALRFPRINRIRWDKPANEADILNNLNILVKSNKL